MVNKKKIICVIPARLDSQRFPRKVLSRLCGRPLLEWVWFSAKATSCFDEVVFAVDAQETADLITSFGGTFSMTSLGHATGTDRLIEVMKSNSYEGDLWVNWQADEPFISQQIVKDLLSGWESSHADVFTLKKLINSEDELTSPNTVKVVSRLDGTALYFSRSTIPYYRGPVIGAKKYYKHIGIYAYTTESLLQIEKMPLGFLENSERLEQLRFLENGLIIGVNQTSQEVIDINVPEDLEKAELFARKNNLNVPGDLIL